MTATRAAPPEYQAWTEHAEARCATCTPWTPSTAEPGTECPVCGTEMTLLRMRKTRDAAAGMALVLAERELLLHLQRSDEGPFDRSTEKTLTAAVRSADREYRRTGKALAGFVRHTRQPQQDRTERTDEDRHPDVVLALRLAEQSAERAALGLEPPDVLRPGRGRNKPSLATLRELVVTERVRINAERRRRKEAGA